MPIPAARARPDPSLAPVACEQCGVMTTVGTSHSYVICYATTGGRVAAFQCPAEQHFACSAECAALLAHKCIDEHLRPLRDQKEAAIPPRPV